MNDFEVCPFCQSNMAENGITFVESGCTNFLHYAKSETGEWIFIDSVNGQNPSEVYYACKSCDKELPKDYQEHFSNTL